MALESSQAQAVLDWGSHGKMFYFAKAGWWDRHMRIVVAKKRTHLVLLPLAKPPNRRRFVRAVPLQAGCDTYPKKGLVYLALLLHLKHAREDVFP